MVNAFQFSQIDKMQPLLPASPQSFYIGLHIHAFVSFNRNGNFFHMCLKLNHVRCHCINCTNSLNVWPMLDSWLATLRTRRTFQRVKNQTLNHEIKSFHLCCCCIRYMLSVKQKKNKKLMCFNFLCRQYKPKQKYKT